jgi:predicted nucleic acid-binding protein
LKLFLDTSALVKLFHEEPGTAEVTRLVSASGAEVFVLELAKLELLSAVHRRLRAGEIGESDMATLLDLFDRQLLLFRVLPMGKAVLREAELLMTAHGPREGLRALDALHLAAFCLLGDGDCSFVCADRRLLDIARKMGFEAIYPAE